MKPPSPSPPGGSAIRDTVLDRLRALTAQLPPGTRLPTVRSLIAEFGVSQHVVQGALETLRQEGLISSHVGKGTFVGLSNGVKVKARSVLTLLYQHPYQRGDVIARLIQQRLSIDGHESLILTYSNAAHVMELLKGGARYDSCILQPRSSIMSIALLALLRQRSDHVLIEGHAAEHLDVDAVSNDPARTVELAVSHLFARGHRRIAWVTEAGNNYFFDRTARFFRAWCGGAGLSEAECPVILAETDRDRLGIADLPGVIGRLKGRGKGGLPFTALMVASFVDGPTILSALAANGLETPRDLAVLRLGTPDLESDHAGRITTIGRPSQRAAATVIDRIYWRWANPAQPFATTFDTPELAAYESTSGSRV